MGTHGLICYRKKWKTKYWTIKCGEWTSGGDAIPEVITATLKEIAWKNASTRRLWKRVKELYGYAQQYSEVDFIVLGKGENDWTIIVKDYGRAHEERYSVFVDYPLKTIYMYPYLVDPGTAIAIWKKHKWLVLPGAYDDGYWNLTPDSVDVEWRRGTKVYWEWRRIFFWVYGYELIEPIHETWASGIPRIEVKLQNERVEREIQMSFEDIEEERRRRGE